MGMVGGRGLPRVQHLRRLWAGLVMRRQASRAGVDLALGGGRGRKGRSPIHSGRDAHALPRLQLGGSVHTDRAMPLPLPSKRNHQDQAVRAPTEGMTTKRVFPSSTCCKMNTITSSGSSRIPAVPAAGPPLPVVPPAQSRGVSSIVTPRRRRFRGSVGLWVCGSMDLWGRGRVWVWVWVWVSSGHVRKRLIYDIPKHPQSQRA